MTLVSCRSVSVTLPHFFSLYLLDDRRATFQDTDQRLNWTRSEKDVTGLREQKEADRAAGPPTGPNP